MASKEELYKFSKQLEAVTGIQIETSEQAKLAPLVTELANQEHSGNIKEFLDSIAKLPSSSEEWAKIAEFVTIGESYFLRDRGQISLLKNVILPRILKEKAGQKQLRLVSAGCSSGEEPYSLAILLDSLMKEALNPKHWNIDIIGLDINRELLQKAKTGTYTKWSFRGQGKTIQNKYFDQVDNHWVVKPEIRSMVKFLEYNLLSDSMPNTAKGLFDIDLIICRNVFIYFSEEAIGSVLKKFISALGDNAYLMTGHVELSNQDLGELQTLQMPESVVYQKTKSALLEKKKGERTRLQSSVLKPRESAQREKPTLPETNTTEDAYELEIQKLESDSSSGSLTALFNKGEYDLVISKLTSEFGKEEFDEQKFKLLIEACVNSGNKQKALDFCTKFIELDDFNPAPHFLLAHLSQEAGDLFNTKEHLRRVLYLDPKHVGAHLLLGTLYESECLPERALKMRINALKILGQLDSEDLVASYEDVSVAELRQYLQGLVDQKEKINEKR